MIAVISFIFVLAVSMLVTKVGTVALVHTGMSRESARFQARSAFTGVGFTTSEAEKVVNQPVRRRILMLLMLLGNAGVVTAVSSLVLSFVDTQIGSGSWYIRLGAIAAGLSFLWLLARSRWIDKIVGKWISLALRRYTRLDTRDYQGLLHLAGDYQVTELEVEEEDWLAGKCLKDLRLMDEGVLVLGIQRPGNGPYIGAPTGETEIYPLDRLLLYGRESQLQELDDRRSGWSGEKGHSEAVHRHQDVIRHQEEEEKASGKEGELSN